MRILVAHEFYQQPGGEDQCVAAEIGLLRAQGHEVDEYFLDNDAVDQLPRVRLAARTIWSLPAFRELRELLRARRPQIAQFHNTLPLISPAGYYAARGVGVGVVQTLHNFRLVCPNAILFRDGHICEDCLGRTLKWPGVLHKCYRDSRAASAAITAMLTTHRLLGTWRKAVDAYIALSRFSRDKFIAGGLPPGRIAVKPNFVYPDPGPGTGAGGYAVFVGRLTVEKGVATLLDAWRGPAGLVPLKILGDGPLRPAVQQAAAEHASIAWLGSVPPERVYQIIGDAAFLVFPSVWHEACPRVAIEAFAKGTPIVAARGAAIAEIVDDGRTGLLFTPGDAGELAAAVRRMLAPPADLAGMRQAVRDTYEDRYTAEANYQSLMAIYRQALAGAPASGASVAKAVP